MDTDQEMTEDIEVTADGDWLAEQVALITIEDGFDS